jgi:hypothetical protein
MLAARMAKGGLCHRCQAPMPGWFAVMLCDPCLTKALEERGLDTEVPEAVIEDEPATDGGRVGGGTDKETS